MTKNQIQSGRMPPAPHCQRRSGTAIQVSPPVSNAINIPEGGTICVSAEVWGDKGKDYVCWSVKTMDRNETGRVNRLLPTFPRE